jgi:hypothetical protein
MSLETRETLLRAIAKARTLIDDLVDGRVGSLPKLLLRKAR